MFFSKSFINILQHLTKFFNKYFQNAIFWRETYRKDKLKKTVFLKNFIKIFNLWPQHFGFAEKFKKFHFFFQNAIFWRETCNIFQRDQECGFWTQFIKKRNIPKKVSKQYISMRNMQERSNCNFLFLKKFCFAEKLKKKVFPKIFSECYIFMRNMQKRYFYN